MFELLQDMRIVEGSAFVAAPSGGMTLALLGADVIRFDQIGGGLDAGRWPLSAEGASLYWAGLNKGKRSISVNFREPEGRELIADLIARPGDGAGMFLSNLPAREPLSYASLRKRREDVIVLRISGHRDGSTALDYTVNCAVGFPFATGDARPDAPINQVLPAWDLMAGLTAATGILAAERHRQRTGNGQEIGLALSDIGYATVGNLGYIAEAQVNGSDRQPIGNDIYGAFGRDFETSDGRRVMIAAITRRQWHSLCDATGTQAQMRQVETMLGVDLDDEGQRYGARDVIAPLVARWISARSLAEVGPVFDAAGVCWGPYQSFTQMVREDPRCSTANPLFAEVDQPGIGPILMPGSPLEFGELARRPAAPAPLIGEHTDDILADVMGLSEAQIGALHDRGIRDRTGNFLRLSTAFRKYTNVLKLNSTHTYDMLRHLGAMHASNQPLSHHARPRGGVRIAAAGHQIYVALLSSGPGQDDPARRTGAA